MGIVPGTAPPPVTRVFRGVSGRNPENGGSGGTEMPPVTGALRASIPPLLGASTPSGYLTSEVIWKIGRYSATIMPPTTTPRKAISSGSISDVSASVVDSTSLS